MKYNSTIKMLLLAIICQLMLLNGFAQTNVKLQVDAFNANTVISKHIYGHFSEHLGRCIYDGFWVGENSNIKNQGRIRLDIVDALKKIQIPNLALAWWLFCR